MTLSRSTILSYTLVGCGAGGLEAWFGLVIGRLVVALAGTRAIPEGSATL